MQRGLVSHVRPVGLLVACTFASGTRLFCWPVIVPVRAVEFTCADKVAATE
jgi:hypothetical protein